MTKFFFVLHYIKIFDYVFWIDDDAFFIQQDRDLTSLIPDEGKLVTFCRSPTNKKIFTYLSSGQFLIRGGAAGAEFANAVIDTSLERVEEWWREDLGMFTKGDQDAIVYLLHEDARFKDAAALHDYTSFNSRIADLENHKEEVFLLHFTGPRERKRSDHELAMNQLQTGPSLLSPDVESELLGGRSRSSVLSSFPRVSVGKRKRKLSQKIRRELRKVFRSR
ncbi:hypothetical protein [Litoreibacter roseus]|nr:hypothetical protein [Litoreibacter roseus]